MLISALTSWWSFIFATKEPKLWISGTVISLLSISFFVAASTASATSPLVTVPKRTPSSPTCFLIVNLPMVANAVLKSIASCLIFSAAIFSFALFRSICFRIEGVTLAALPKGNRKFLA